MRRTSCRNPLRVHPRSYCVLTEPSEHEANRGPAQKGETVSVEAFPILSQPAASVQPADYPLDDPAFGQNDELAGIGALDDLEVDPPAHLGKALLKLGPLISAVGIELQQ